MAEGRADVVALVDEIESLHEDDRRLVHHAVVGMKFPRRIARLEEQVAALEAKAAAIEAHRRADS